MVDHISPYFTDNITKEKKVSVNCPKLQSLVSGSADIQIEGLTPEYKYLIMILHCLPYICLCVCILCMLMQLYFIVLTNISRHNDCIIFYSMDILWYIYHSIFI